MASNRLPKGNPPAGYVRMNPNVQQNVQYSQQMQGLPGYGYSNPHGHSLPMMPSQPDHYQKFHHQQPVSRQFFGQYAQGHPGQRMLSPPPVLSNNHGGQNIQQQQVREVRVSEAQSVRQRKHSQNLTGLVNQQLQVHDTVSQLPQYESQIHSMSQQQVISQQYGNQKHQVQFNYPPQQYRQHQQQYQQQYQQYQYPNQYSYQNHPENSEKHNQLNGQSQDTMIWAKRFFTIFQKFQWAYQRCQMLKTDYQQVHQQLKIVDSQEDWNALKDKHQELLEKFMGLQEEMAAVMGENQQLIEQKPQNADEERVWEQRYQQLLDNYKSLQQEINNSRHNRSNQAIKSPLQADPQLSKQFRDLKIQYTKIFNQYKDLKRKETRQQKQKHQIIQKLQQAVQENQKYKQHLQKMHAEYEQLQNNYHQLQSNSMALKREMASKPKIDRGEYQRFMQIIQQKDNEISQARRELANKDSLNYRTQEELQLKGEEINSLKNMIAKIEDQYASGSGLVQQYNRMIAAKSEEVTQYRRMLKTVEDDYQGRMEQLELDLKRGFQQQITEMQKQIDSLNEKAEESHSTHRLKMSSSQKKLNYFEQEMSNIQQLLHQKNEQVLQLRSLTYQIESLKALKDKCQELNSEKCELLDMLKVKSSELQSHQSQIVELQSQIKGISQRKTQSSTRALSEEMSSLNEILKSKDGQLAKLRSGLQLKQKHITDLQTECEVERSKVICVEKGFEGERDNYRTQLKMLEGRNADLQRKTRSLQFDFGESVKSSMQAEIMALRGQNHSRQETITKLENLEIELRAKLAQVQREKKDLQLNLRDLKSKVKDQSNQGTDQNRRIEVLVSDIHSRDKIIKSMSSHQQNLKTQLTRLQSQIIDNQNTLKVKSSIISQLEQKVKSMNDDLYKYYKERDSLRATFKKSSQDTESIVRNLREQVQEYEQLIDSGKLSKDLEYANNQNMKIITTLKIENDKLRKQLTRGFDAKQSKISLLAKSPKSQSILKGGQGLNFIQKRLFDFNSKLEGMIHEEDHQKSLGDKSTNQNKQNNNDTTYKQQIRTLKDKLSELQSYCAALEVRVGNQIFQMTSPSTIVFAEQEKIHQEQMEFHRLQTQQFQNRIDSLLQVNKELKNRLESLLRTNADNSSVTYFKGQLEQSEKSIEVLNQKLRKIVQENRTLRIEAAEMSSKYAKDYDQKHFDMENQVRELTRKIRLLEIEKVSAENERATLVHNISQLESNTQILKSNLGQKISSFENTNNELTIKITRYQNEIKILNNRLQSVESSSSRVDRSTNQRKDRDQNQIVWHVL